MEYGESSVFIWYCLNKIVCEFENFNIGAVNAIQTKSCLNARNGQANQKFASINTIAVSLFLLELLFACNPAVYFKMRKKLWRYISFSSTYFFYYRKHYNNDNKICSFLYLFSFYKEKLRFSLPTSIFCLLPIALSWLILIT